MAEALRVSARATAPTLQGVISLVLGGKLRVVASGIPDPSTVWLAYGAVVAGPPATYADFGADFGGVIAFLQASMAVEWNAEAGEFTYTMTLPIGPLWFSEGDVVWMALFDGGSAPPGPTEVPTATAGPFPTSP